MTLRIYLISFIFTLLAAPSPSSAQEQQRYRVEVLVLKHLQHAEAGRVGEGLRDYSGALDLRLPVETEDEIVCPPEPSLESEAMADGAADGETGQGEDEELPDPNAVVLVEEMGPEMADAWRRLRLSGPFRPLQHLAWEQGNQAPFPNLRLYNEEVVWIDDPYADMRATMAEEQEEASEPAAVAADPCDPAYEPTGSPLDEAADSLPDPVTYYELDGQVSLDRRRFLHLNLDLELRERIDTPDAALLSPTPETTLQRTPGRRALPSLEQRATPDFRVFAMEQARQVRSGRMEYFDGPVIGVLAWVTPIAVAEPSER